jgi:hypothetical protein
LLAQWQSSRVGFKGLMSGDEHSATLPWECATLPTLPCALSE